ncbi:MAG: hypothetical protein O3C27_08885 [Actinomycetota bacterium]|nr:hypothetical protein [Actinomycetota bacterium]
MLWDSTGSPRAAVISLSHLDEPERHFAITLILSRVISWMRSQPGTTELRALIYIDEVMGLAPPVGNPAPKKPILTLLEQARAFGVGLVLSTQNPVDLDYKAISNAGTWMIGRLQTEQDKNRLVDGLRGADGGVDVGEVERVISGLAKRQFVLWTAKTAELPLFSSRWALSYLAGPRTRERISELMTSQRASIAPARASSAADTPTEPPTSEASDESTIPPSLPDDLLVRYLHPSAPWAAAVGADQSGTRLVPMLVARVNLLFDDAAADVRHIEQWEAVLPLTGDRVDVGAVVTVDFDDRYFVLEPPPNARYVSPEFTITKAALKGAQASLKDRLYATRSLDLLTNPHLKLWPRPGEPPEAFALRCGLAAEEQEDVAAEKIRAKLETQRARIDQALAKAQDRVNELETHHEGRRTQNIIDLGTSLLGGLLGGRRRARSMATAARRAAGGRREQQSAEARLDSAQNRVAEKFDELEQLEHQLQDALIEIDDEWTAKAQAVEPLEISLEKTDITIADWLLVWVPVTS